MNLGETVVVGWIDGGRHVLFEYLGNDRQEEAERNPRRLVACPPGDKGFPLLHK